MLKISLIEFRCFVVGILVDFQDDWIIKYEKTNIVPLK